MPSNTPQQHCLEDSSHPLSLALSVFPAKNTACTLAQSVVWCAHVHQQVHDTQKLLERESQLLQQELSTLTAELTGWASKTQVGYLLLYGQVVWPQQSLHWSVRQIECD